MQNRFENAPGREPSERFRGLIEANTSLADSLWRNQVGDRAARQVLAVHSTYEAALVALRNQHPPEPYVPPRVVYSLAQDMYQRQPQQLGRAELDAVLAGYTRLQRQTRLDMMPRADLQAAEQVRLDIEDLMIERFGVLPVGDTAFTVRTCSPDGLVLKARVEEQIVDLAFAARDTQPLVQFGVRDTYDTYLPQQPRSALQEHIAQPETTDLLLVEVNERLDNVHDGLIWNDSYQWP